MALTPSSPLCFLGFLISAVGSLLLLALARPPSLPWRVVHLPRRTLPHGGDLGERLMPRALCDFRALYGFSVDLPPLFVDLPLALFRCQSRLFLLCRLQGGKVCLLTVDVSYSSRVCLLSSAALVLVSFSSLSYLASLLHHCLPRLRLSSVSFLCDSSVIILLSFPCLPSVCVCLLPLLCMSFARLYLSIICALSPWTQGV